MYQVMILPLFVVGDTFYQGSTQAMRNKLQTLQNRAMRIIYHLPRLMNVDEYTEKSNLLPLIKRRKLLLIQLANWMTSKDKYRDLTTGTTRSHDPQRKRLTVPLSRKNKTKRSFLYQSSTLWKTYLQNSTALMTLFNLREE